MVREYLPVLALIVQMPSNARVAALQKEIRAEGKPTTPAQMKEMQELQARISKAPLWGAVLMGISVLCLAIAPEIGKL